MLPTDKDILCGRGMHNFKHAGNIALRTNIFLKLDEYLACQRKREKTAIIRGVIDEVLSEGGSFLKYDTVNKVWFDGGMAAAKIRVGVGFRDAKSPDKLRYVRDMQSSLTTIDDDPEPNDSTSSPQEKISCPSTVQSSSLLDLVVPRNLPSVSSPVANEHLHRRRTSMPRAAFPSLVQSNHQSITNSTQMTNEENSTRNVASIDPFSPRFINSHNKTATAATFLQYALTGVHDETLDASPEQDTKPMHDDTLEEIDIFHDGSPRTFWDAFMQERLIPPKCSSSDDDSGSKDESLFSDTTLNDIFGSVGDISIPWEPLLD